MASTVSKTERQANIIRCALSDGNLPNPLRLALRNYTAPVNVDKNSEFIKTVSAIRPEWIIDVNMIGSVRTNKKALMLMAVSGWDKPKTTGRIGRALQTYCCENHKNYDVVFASRVREIRPDWFGGSRLIP